jgi:hypothetical protein
MTSGLSWQTRLSKLLNDAAGKLVISGKTAANTYKDLLVDDDGSPQMTITAANITDLVAAMQNLPVVIGLISGEDEENLAIRTLSRGYAHAPVIEGEVADTAIGSGAGVIAKVCVTAAGTATAVINIYDGAVAAENLVASISGASVGVTNLEAMCSVSMHVATVDAGGDSSAMRVVVLYAE